MAERRIEHVEVEVDGVRRAVAVDLEESPLGWLARRRARDGHSFIAPVQLIAGERLRADFTRAGMAPRLTANWDAVTRTDRAGGTAGLNASEAMLAARQRVADKADLMPARHLSANNIGHVAKQSADGRTKDMENS